MRLMKNHIIITFLLLCFSHNSIAQKKTRADRFFEKGDYINAAIQYEAQMDRDGYSKHVLQNISTCYYNTFKFRKALRYLKILTRGKFYAKDKSYDNYANFMMYQVLSSMGEYDKSLAYLALYRKNSKQLEIDKDDAIDVIESFRLKDDDYKVKPVRFNSDAAEFGAVKVDDFVYFTSDRSPNGILDKRYKWTHRPFLNIFKLDQAKNNLTPLPGKVNSNLHEGNFCFSNDGNIMYISKSNTEKGKKRFDSIKNNAIHLYKSEKVDGLWEEPQKLSFNNVNYSIEHPALSKDGTKLFFSSNMPGGEGGFDLYYVPVNGDGTYGSPINLGPEINTSEREQFPFIDDKGNLFFSSNGHLGLGMMDIYVCEFKNSSFGPPINLGAPLNSKYDDFSLTYYNDTKGYFASNRKYVNDDIYSFEQIGEIFPRVYKARFEVKDYASENYIPNAAVKLFDRNQELVYENQLDTIGAFERNLYPGKYDFKAEAKGYKSRIKPLMVKEKKDATYVIYLDREQDSASMATANIPQKEKQPTKEELKAELLKDTEGPPVVEKNGKLFFELPPIYFDYNKWNIRADSKKVLDEFALKLEKYKTVYIKISSHTDSRGTDSYNQILSEKRAESTRNYLALIGYVNARRMKFEGFGESKPLIDCISKNCSEEEHQTNRRSEFEITKY